MTHPKQLVSKMKEDIKNAIFDQVKEYPLGEYTSESLDAAVGVAFINGFHFAAKIVPHLMFNGVDQRHVIDAINETIIDMGYQIRGKEER